MKTARFAITVIALPLAAGLLGVSPATHAQQRTTMRYSQWDTNGDGRITRAEWQGTRAAFNAADINSDGVLSGTEVQVSGNQDRRPGEFDLGLDNDDQPVGTSGSVGNRRSQFMALDANGDGILSRGEWNGNRVTFDRNDINGDGVITRREYVGIEAGNTQGTAGSRVRGGAATNRVVISVDPRARWTDTGIYVNTGDIILFNTRGTTQLSDDAADVAVPAGSQSGRHAAGAPIPDALAGALIGRIGNSAPFGIGNQVQINAPATGQLYLGVNDDHLPDNSGGFRVSIDVR
jgi:hypothetical protein